MLIKVEIIGFVDVFLVMMMLHVFSTMIPLFNRYNSHNLFSKMNTTYLLLNFMFDVIESRL